MPLDKIISIFPFYIILLIYTISTLTFVFTAFDRIKMLFLKILTEFLFTGIPESEYTQIYPRRIVEILTKSTANILKIEERKNLQQNPEFANTYLNVKFLIKLLPSLIKIIIIDSLKHPVSNFIIFPLFVLLPMILQAIATKYKKFQDKIFIVYYLFYLSIINQTNCKIDNPTTYLCHFYQVAFYVNVFS